MTGLAIFHGLLAGMKFSVTLRVGFDPTPAFILAFTRFRLHTAQDPRDAGSALLHPPPSPLFL